MKLNKKEKERFDVLKSIKMNLEIKKLNNVPILYCHDYDKKEYIFLKLLTETEEKILSEFLSEDIFEV